MHDLKTRLDADVQPMPPTRAADCSLVGSPVQVDGRPLRVLHSGNIANNAYLNAKALRFVGVYADVLSEDYYHIMGCPEWEDAPISGTWGDDFAPDWAAAGIGDFQRPDWFHSGTFQNCCRTLENIGEPLPPIVVQPPLPLAERVLSRIRSLRHSPRLLAFFTRHPLIFRVARFGVRSIFRVRFHIAVRVQARANAKAARALTKAAKEPVAQDQPVQEAAVPEPAPAPAPAHQNHPALAVVARFEELFPERRGQMRPEEVAQYIGRAAALRPAFARFDLLHQYGTRPIDAYLSGKRPYVAFEHGTIRAMPFEENTQGALLALAYREADHVLITNSDNYAAAKKLGIKTFSFIPHPVNEDYLEPDDEARELARDIRERHDASFVLIHPSRQHWSKERHPDWEKGNDLLIKGFARLVKEVDPRALAVMVDWGAKVKDSKALLERLGCADRVLWIKPLPHRPFARWINASDAVADQFFLGAFGSLTPKGMACGKPVLLNLNEDLHRWCFDELPPVLNVKTEDQVFEALRLIATDPAKRAEIGRKGAEWYWNNHSMAVIRAKLLDVYGDVLSRRGVPVAGLGRGRSKGGIKI